MSDTAMLITAIGGIGQADQAYEAGKRNQAIDRYDANLASIQADQAMETGSFQMNQVAVRGQILRGAQQGAAAGGNTVATAGTNRIIQAGGEAVSAMDELMIGINAQRQAFGYKVRAANLDFQGDLARRAGNEAALAALIKTGATEEMESDPNYRGRGTAAANNNAPLISQNDSSSGSIFDSQV